MNKNDLFRAVAVSRMTIMRRKRPTKGHGGKHERKQLWAANSEPRQTDNQKEIKACFIVFFVTLKWIKTLYGYFCHITIMLSLTC